MLALICIRHADGCNRFLYTIDDWLSQRHQRPDCRHTHGAGTNQTNTLLIDRTSKFLHGHAIRQNTGHRIVRYKARPGDENTNQHSQPAGNTDQIAGTNQCRRITNWELRHAFADVEPQRQTVRQDMEATGAQSDEAGHKATGHDFLESASLLGICLGVAADLEYLGCSHAFRIGQIAMNDHCPAKRNREEYAQAAAAGRYQQCLPELESLPVADHKHTRNDEDDSGQCPRCRRLRLHHIVLENIGILSHLKDSHGDYCCRNCR